MMVYVVDRRAPDPPQPIGIVALQRRQDSFESGWRRVIEQFAGHENAQILFVEPAEAFGDLAGRIAATVSNPWSIWMLRIICHGAQAYLQLGAGVEMAQIRHFNRFKQALTPAHLRGRGIEIHGCNVAQGPRGQRFVNRIASTVELPVVASPNIQQADNMFRFEGPDIYRAAP